MRKEVVVNKIVNRMVGILDEGQVELLQRAVTIVLYDYNVEPAKNELIEYDNYDQFLIEQYYAALNIEGKSHKTIDRYLSQIRTMMDWIQKPLREINTEDLRYYLAVY